MKWSRLLCCMLSSGLCLCLFGCGGGETPASEPADAPSVPPAESSAAPAPTAQAPWESEEAYADYYRLSTETQYGDSGRLAEFLRKCENGETVRVGFIGGSNTDSGPGPALNGWAGKRSDIYSEQILSWLRQTYPQANIVNDIAENQYPCIGVPIEQRYNIANGATASDFGVFRITSQLLDKSPDLVIVEYTTNDGPGDDYDETFESLCRKILSAPNHPAIIGVGNRNAYGTSEPYLMRTAKHYNFPWVSFTRVLNKGEETGAFTLDNVSGDTVHWNVQGHHLMAQLIISRLEDVREQLDTLPAPEDYTLPEPRTAARYEDATMLWSAPVGNAPAYTPDSWGSWEKGDGNYQDKNYNTIHGFVADTTGGAPLRCTVQGRLITLWWASTGADKASTATVVVDKGTAQEKTIEVSTQNGAPFVKTVVFGEETDTLTHTLEITCTGTDGGAVNLCGIGVASRT